MQVRQHLHNDRKVAPHGILYDILPLCARGGLSFFPHVVLHQEDRSLLTLCRHMPAQRFCFSPRPLEGHRPSGGRGEKKYIGGENTMAKRICAFLTALLMVLSLAACGKTYTCGSCGKKTSQAYYDFWGSRNSLLCRNCAVAYWGDMFSEDLRVN